MRHLFTVTDELFDKFKARTKDVLLVQNIASIDKPLQHFVSLFDLSFPNVTTVWTCSGHFEEDEGDDEVKFQLHVAFVCNERGAPVLEAYLNELYRLWHFDENLELSSGLIHHDLTYSFVRLMNPFSFDGYVEPGQVYGSYPIVFVECTVRDDAQRSELIAVLTQALNNIKKD